MRRFVLLLVVFCTVVLIACKKNEPKGSTETPLAPSKQGSTLDLIRDSVFLYAKEAYYWNDGLPDYATFKPRAFTGSNDLDALTKEVNAISQYKIDPATGKAYEYYKDAPGEAKYSFIDEGQVSTELGGTQGDFGFAPLYRTETDLRIKYVYPGSPADKAGVKRGYKVISVNGNSSITYDNGGTNTQFVGNAFFNSKNIALVLEKQDLSRITVNITAGSYTTNPILTYKIINGANGHKIGYFVFNSFTSENNAKPKLDEVFNFFAANGVTDLVVDFRYNGGGYVSTAEYLSNLMVPAAKNNSLMYSTLFNSTLTSGKAKILANQVRRDAQTGEVYNYAQFNYTVADNQVKFSKVGSLNTIGKVCFIVGGGTASASELVINSMLGVKSALDVKLIGSTTYGKPVGFFDIEINKYELYVPEFETKNALNEGGYYTGMMPGTTQYPGLIGGDDLTHDFGDGAETLLSYAVNYIGTGKYTTTDSQLQIQSREKNTFSVEQAAAAGKVLNAGKFSGLIYDKPFKIKH